ncbi:MAG: hypothetical protein GZ085_11485 [Sulfuriferula multivorans]|uniref:Uncharacterized protein n=1 Tax=Sulfuriferula multivorans TaxID=1559896 RepID=A0A7C9TAU5_9PROT|nr:hypothetical protein [Sulfuriferula multivorans]
MKDHLLPVTVDVGRNQSRDQGADKAHALVCEAPVSDRCELISRLVGEVYEVAPAVERSRLLTHLLKPLGVLSIVAVANGIFSKVRFNNGWTNLDIRPEDVENVRAIDVVTLVNYVQQVSISAVDGLAQVLAASPVMTGSAVTAVLITILASRSRNRPTFEEDDFDVDLR